MPCGAIITGDEFLLRILGHIDCQAQVIGSYGYQALGEPGSLASTLVAGLLTLFIALFGIRLLFGPPPAARDVVVDLLKIGIVLTLAFSWPAFRTVVYDVTLNAPAEIGSLIEAGSGNRVTAPFANRLQQTDNAIVRLTEAGAGRNTGALIDSNRPGGTFEGSALKDEESFGTARLLYLASVTGTLALLRIAAGVLLALTPIVAGLYFFQQSRGIFGGWLKGLVFTIAGSIGATIVLSVELAILNPFLSDALSVRALGYATPSAPTELFAIVLAFTVVKLLMLWLLAKVVFHRGWLTLPDIPALPAITVLPSTGAPTALPAQSQTIIRAESISNTIESSVRRERTSVGERMVTSGVQGPAVLASPTGAGDAQTQARLGNSYRRSTLRASHSTKRRDNRS
ncbi:type IV secretion system protein [Erythrobacter ani]|uniref:Type IV secretion system protein n=1 Tax=Erythrobacter ani TaxID=2827235 RepID=A0ABS6SMJ0_9SPHN|nr:type IV secretion system protein [Erythrobacter ani]MBV7266260.1 type IV secretion system protein [Erythrobacter ani]